MGTTKPTKQVLSESLTATLDNARRLADDAGYLYDCDRYPSSFALSILAQEEYAKAFMLHLVETGAIPWNDEVRRILRDHSTKQLLMLVMDFLEPDEEKFGGFMALLESRRKGNYYLPPHVVDAVHIIRHEKVPRRGEADWMIDSDRPCDSLARQVADGKFDREKQGALYVQIARDGRVTRTPVAISKEVAEAELERMKRVGQLICRHGDKLYTPSSVEFRKISTMFQVLFGLCTIEEYQKNWWNLPN